MRRRDGPTRRSVGVDLAAQPARTGVVVVDWHPGGSATLALPFGRGGATDDALVDLLAGLGDGEVAGVDGPLGWPDAFRVAVEAHTTGAPWPGVELPGDDARRRLRYRHTDFHVHDEIGRWPLSVSSDLIGVLTMRWAGLEHRLRAAGVPVDRSGLTGRVVEVYPAAARLRWGLPTRVADVAALRALVPRLNVPGPVAAELAANPHAYDAVLAALLARAARRGLTLGPPDHLRDAARREGWVHVPAGPLDVTRLGGSG